MSNFSFLLPNAGAIDNGLDTLFSTSLRLKKPIPVANKPNKPNQTTRKRKKTQLADSSDEEKSTGETALRKEQKKKKDKTKQVGDTVSLETYNAPDSAAVPTKKVGREKTFIKPNSHLKGISSLAGSGSNSTSESESEWKPSNLEHETLQNTSPKHPRKKSKYIPPSETPTEKNARTIFVGNLPVVVASKKRHVKELYRHLLSYAPTAQIESSRFRSIPFSEPTSAPPAAITPRSVQHRLAGEADEEDPEKNNTTKTFLTTAQKKKIAFVGKKFHAEADSVNCYVVLAHADPERLKTSSECPLDPFVAASMIASAADGSTFLERILRVDVAKSSGHSSLTNPTSNTKTTPDYDAKTSIFIGNLPFGTQEDDLRAFFEGILVAERGMPSIDSDGNPTPNGWIVRVRIIRDRETQLGKGFAYIGFRDKDCVEELTALDPDTRFKFGGRVLRVQRCHSRSSASSLKDSLSSHPKAVKAKSKSLSQIPKGDPNLGARISTLTKEKRKEVKSADEARIARRAAKKSLKRVLVKDGIERMRSKLNKNKSKARRVQSAS